MARAGKGFGATIGCIFITLLLLVVSVAVLYAYSTTDTAYLGNESDPNSTYYGQHQSQLSFLLLVDMIFWALTLIMAGVTLIVALAML